MRREAGSMRRLIVIFLITIVFPGFVLGFLGVRALRQERQLRDQQIREKLATVAEHAGGQLEAELAAWQSAADQVAGTTEADPNRWPERLQLIMSDPAGAVVLAGRRDRPEP